IRQLLRTIGGMSSLGEPVEAQYRLETKPLDRSVHESRNAEMACDSNATALLARRADLREVLAAVDEQLAAIFSSRFAAVHEALVKAVSSPGDAAQDAARYYRWFDRFDCVQFPMSFGTDIGEPDQVDIVRIAPEDAQRLVPDISARRRKLK